jgi:hypothetical protein
MPAPQPGQPPPTTALPPLLPSPHCPCVLAPPACLPCSQNALRKKYWTLTKKQADSDSEAMELTGGRCLQLPCCCLQLPCPQLCLLLPAAALPGPQSCLLSCLPACLVVCLPGCRNGWLSAVLVG